MQNILVVCLSAFFVYIMPRAACAATLCAESISHSVLPAITTQKLTLKVMSEGWARDMTSISIDPIRATLVAANIPILNVDADQRTIDVLATEDQIPFLSRVGRVAAVWSEDRTTNYMLALRDTISPAEVARRQTLSAVEQEANDPSRMSVALREKVLAGKGKLDLEIWVMLLDDSYRAEYIDFLRFLDEYGVIHFESPLSIFAGIKFYGHATPEAIAEIASWEPKAGRPKGKLIQYLDVWKGEMSKKIPVLMRDQ